jgi:hypothetical protein
MSIAELALVLFFLLLFLQVLSALDILQPPHIDFFQEMYVNLVTSYR